MNAINQNAHPIGRILLGLLFLVAGLSKLLVMGPDAFAGFIGSQMPSLTFLAWPVILYEILAGLAIIVGFKTRMVALSLVVFCLFSGIVYHGMADMTGMLKNFALAGGFLMLTAHGAGKWSSDHRV